MRRRQGGYVTAEAAVVIPFLIAVALALVWVVTIGVAQVRAVDAARDAARAVARGDTEQSAVAEATADAPDGAEVTFSSAGDDVTATVSAQAEAPDWLILPWPSVDVTSSATVRREPGAGEGP